MKGWIALTLFAAASCSSSHICNCPANGCDHGCDATSLADGELLLAPALPAVQSTSANSPCSTDYQPSAGRILVSRPGAGTCSVNVQLVDGSSYAAQVRFIEIDGPCGCYLGSFASALEPTTDAGSD